MWQQMKSFLNLEIMIEGEDEKNKSILQITKPKQKLQQICEFGSQEISVPESTKDTGNKRSGGGGGGGGERWVEGKR